MLVVPVQERITEDILVPMVITTEQFMVTIHTLQDGQVILWVMGIGMVI